MTLFVHNCVSLQHCDQQWSHGWPHFFDCISFDCMTLGFHHFVNVVLKSCRLYCYRQSCWALCVMVICILLIWVVPIAPYIFGRTCWQIAQTHLYYCYQISVVTHLHNTNSLALTPVHFHPTSIVWCISQSVRVKSCHTTVTVSLQVTCNTGDTALLQENHTTCKRERIKILNSRFWDKSMTAACSMRYFVQQVLNFDCVQVPTTVSKTIPQSGDWLHRHPKSLICFDVWNACNVFCNFQDAPMTILIFYQTTWPSSN